MFGKLLCKLFGHKRGKRTVYQPVLAGAMMVTQYRCPRCGLEWTRKASAKKAAA